MSRIWDSKKPIKEIMNKEISIDLYQTKCTFIKILLIQLRLLQIIKYMDYSILISHSVDNSQNNSQLFMSQFNRNNHKIRQQSTALPHLKNTKLLKCLIFIATLILLFPRANAVTDISLQNCPSQYNISKANETSPDDSQLVNSFYSGFSSSSDNSRIQQIVLTGNKQELQLYVKQKIVPYAIYGGVVFLVFLMLLYYCLFDKSFPPCQSLRRNPLQKPYTKVEKRCMSYWLLIIASIIFSAGIVSFTAIPKMKNYIQYTKCSIYNLIDVSLNGDVGNGWGGFLSLKYKIGNISSLLDSANTQVNTYISGDDWLVNNVLAMKNKNIQIYNKNKDAMYITPNPDTTKASLLAGGGFPQVNSVFISSGLGPNGTINTMTDDIDRGLRITSIKSNQAYQIQLSAQAMVQATDTIKSNAVAAQNTLSMYLRQFQVVKTQTDSFVQQFFDQYFTTAIYILQGVVGFVLVSSLLVLIGTLSTHFYQIFQCRYMVHCGWFLYSLMYFGMLVLAFITLSMGTVGYYSCLYFNQSMTNSTSYHKIGQKYSQNIFNRLDICIVDNGDGNVLKKFNINNQMKTVTDLFTNISQYFEYDNPSSSNYVDLAISTAKIQGWINAIQKYRLGIYVDSRPIQTTNDNPNYAIGQLNLYSNTGGGVATCSKDRWVFDKTNCTDRNQQNYTADATLAHGQDLSFSRGVVTCISLNQKLTTSMTYSWSQADIIYRYLQIRQSCPDAYDAIIKYSATLINFRDSRLALFQAIKDQLNQLYTLNTNFNNIMTSFRARVNQFYESVATLNNVVSNQATGLLNTANCRVLGDNTKATYNIFCVNFMVQVVKVGVCTLIMLITMMVAMCLGAIFGTRYANVQMLKRVDGQQHQQVLQNSSEEKMGQVALDKQIMFSERSHSSQEDQKDKKPNAKVAK